PRRPSDLWTTGHGPACTTVTGTTAPDSSKIWVMPSFFPMIPAIAPPSVDLDLHVDTGRKIQLGQRVDRLRARVENIDHPLVRLQLELLAALLVDVRRAEHGPALNARRERDRPANPRAGLLRRTHDIRRSLIDHRVIETL